MSFYIYHLTHLKDVQGIDLRTLMIDAKDHHTIYGILNATCECIC